MPKTIETPSGRIAFAEAGTGPVALFVHGVLLNKHLWRHQLAALSDIRRCIAVDLSAHGDTEIGPDQSRHSGPVRKFGRRAASEILHESGRSNWRNHPAWTAARLLADVPALEDRGVLQGPDVREF
jgi:pimeloyl-ACP methyl ester carboxylesterase